jgi:hypothetical protein
VTPSDPNFEHIPDPEASSSMSLSRPPRPRTHVRRLNTLSAVRAEMARCYADARKGAITIGDAARLVSGVLQPLARVIEGSTLEERIVALERAQEPNPASSRKDL